MKSLRHRWFIRILLYPLAGMYGLVTDIRNFLYERGIFKTRSFDRPVISVGNITAGGSGKTPFIMLMIDLLAAKNKLVVVSRGYSRSSRGLRIVSDGNGTVIPVSESGDEPGLIARRFPQTPVIVAERRVDGINEAIRQFNPDVILLDDAYQHRRAGRNCDIVLITARTRLNRERMLPLGNLREKLKHLNRATMIVISGGGEVQGAEDNVCLQKYFQGPLFQCHFRPICFVNTELVKKGNLTDLRGRRCLAFSAIAHPHQFREMLIEEGILVDPFFEFPDHHFFSEADQRKLTMAAQENQINLIITTEKDIVKLDPYLFNRFDLVAVRREGHIQNLSSFLNILSTLIDLKT